MPHPSSRIAVSLLVLATAAALAACSPQAGTPQASAEAAATTHDAEAHAAQGSDDARAFAIGTLQAIALRDGALEFPNDNQVFGLGHTPGDVAALLTAAGAPADGLQLSLQPLLVKTPERVLLFDTGAGTNFGAATGHLSASLAAAGVDPGSVSDIFISHAHGDHVGGLVDARGALVFPNATVHLSAPEWSFLRGLDEATARNVGITAHAALVAAIAPKVATFAPGTEVVPGLVGSVEITGHTPGHSGYLIGSGADSLLYIGDALHHSVVSVQRPEWANGFDADAQTASASRSSLLESTAASGQRIYAVHFPFPGLGKIARDGETFTWVAE